MRRDGAMTIYPARIAVGVVLLLPNGDAGFDFINNILAGAERFGAVFGGDSNPDGDFADVEATDAMDAARVEDVEFLARFRKDAFAFFDGEFFKRFVFERGDLFAVVVIAHPALERHERACAWIGEG